MTTATDPLNFLLPGGSARRRRSPVAQQPDPLATLLANSSQPQGLVPAEMVGEDIEEPAMQPAQPAQPAQPDVGAEPAAQPPSSQWSSWLEQPANRAFMLSFGLQLMTGGWGGVGAQLAQAIGAGSVAANEQQRRDQQLARQGQQEEMRGNGRVGRRRGRRVVQPGTVPSSPEEAALPAVPPELNAVEEFISRGPTPEQWATENQPGGLIYTVFGGPQEQARAGELLQLVQQQTQQQQQPSPYANMSETQLRNLSDEDLIALGSSRNPADIARFQREAARRYRSPGVGYRWGVNEQGLIDRVPLTGAGGAPGRGGRGGSVREQVQAAGIGSARLAINNLREYVRGQIGGPISGGPEIGMVPRAVGQLTGVGDYWRNASGVRDAIASYMHARSGQTVTNREMDRYLDLYMPAANSSSRDIYYKLAMLELNTSLLGRALGDTSVTNEGLLNAYNEARRNSGHAEVGMDEFMRLLPNIEQQALASAPAGMRFAPRGAPAPSGPGRNIPMVPARPSIGGGTIPPTGTLPPPTAGPESLAPAPAPAPRAPAPGTIMQGYRFKGGDPSKPESWERVR